MPKRAHPQHTERAHPRNRDIAPSTIDCDTLQTYVRTWIDDGEVRGLSPNTLSSRKLITDNLLWFLRQRDLECDARAIREFLVYVRGGDGESRWGRESRIAQAKPSTVATYHRRLRALFEFLTVEDLIDQSPMASIRPPVARQSQVQPYTEEEVRALMAASRGTTDPERDHALLLFLLDSGCRASEACGLKIRDLDLRNNKCVVWGKGGKSRAVYIGTSTSRALLRYLASRKKAAPDEHLWRGDRGRNVEGGLTRSGLLSLMRRLGKAAGVQRAGVHRCRHTFAITALRNGMNVFSLQQLLGHESLRTVHIYLAIAQADIQEQHRQYSPVEALRGRR